jgi:hypothetical protein
MKDRTQTKVQYAHTLFMAHDMRLTVNWQQSQTPSVEITPVSLDSDEFFKPQGSPFARKRQHTSVASILSYHDAQNAAVAVVFPWNDPWVVELTNPFNADCCFANAGLHFWNVADPRALMFLKAWWWAEATQESQLGGSAALFEQLALNSAMLREPEFVKFSNVIPPTTMSIDMQEALDNISQPKFHIISHSKALD